MLDPQQLLTSGFFTVLYFIVGSDCSIKTFLCFKDDVFPQLFQTFIEMTEFSSNIHSSIPLKWFELNRI